MKRIFLILSILALVAVGCHSTNNQSQSENESSSSSPQVVVVTSPYVPAKTQPVPAQPYRFYTKGKTFTGGT